MLMMHSRINTRPSSHPYRLVGEGAVRPRHAKTYRLTSPLMRTTPIQPAAVADAFQKEERVGGVGGVGE